MLAILVGIALAAQGAPADVSTAEAPVLLAQATAPAPDGGTGAAATGSPQPPAPPPLYQPPRSGQPRGRISGITRESGEPPARPRALAPEHVAETVAARPRLYWSIDRAHAGTVRFALSERDATEPACELALPAATRPGTHLVDLAACPGDLEPGREYEWFVAVVVDPRQPSRDRIAQGWIRRVSVPEDLDPGRAEATDFARRGLWYDALDRAATTHDRATWSALLTEVSITSAELP